MTIGEYMRTAREEAGLSQEQLADKSGVSKRSIEQYENNLTSPGLMNLLSLSDALEVSIDDYVGHRIKKRVLKIRVADPRVKELVKQNEGYCPCMVHKTPDTKCMCKAFRDQKEPGPCHCGLYEKFAVEEADNG